MAIEVKMTKLGMTMTEGRIMEWEKKEGDLVKKDETLFSVTTDKVTMDVNAPKDGVIIKILFEEGDTVPVGEIVAWIGQKDERVNKSSFIEDTTSNTMTNMVYGGMEGKNNIKVENKNDNIFEIQGNIRATPTARAYAKQNGIMINTVLGSGSYGRILRKDVEKFLELTAKTSLRVENQLWEDIELLQAQKVSAAKMTENFTTVPHFYLTARMDVSTMIKMLENARVSMKETSDNKATFTDVLIWILSRVISKHPKVNSSLIEGKIRMYKNVNIGIATDTEQGLIVPVIHNANKMTFSKIVNDRKKLVDLARKGKLMPDDIAGGTFTISNLGMFEIYSFNAIINSPQSALLAVGGITKVLVKKSDNIVEIPLVNMSLSCDHRVLDGATGAKFLKELKEVIENPVKLLDSDLF